LIETATLMQGRNDDVDDLKRTRPSDRLEEQTGGLLPNEYSPSTKKHKCDDPDGGPAPATMDTGADSSIDQHGHDTGHSCILRQPQDVAKPGLFVTTVGGPEQQMDGNDDMSTGATMVMDVDDETTTPADYCFYLEDRHLPPARSKGSLPLPRGDWAMIRPSPRQKSPLSRQSVRSAQRQVWGSVVRTKRSKDEDDEPKVSMM
jgi:hypothetical protein